MTSPKNSVSGGAHDRVRVWIRALQAYTLSTIASLKKETPPMFSHALRMKFIVLAAASTLALVGCSDKDEKAPIATAPSGPSGTAAPSRPVSDGILPGSQEELERDAGSRIYFGYDEYNLDDRAQATLSKQAQWLKRYPNKSFTIEGHADERGTREYNLALGARRAEAAKRYMVGLGIEEGRLNTISYGKERPEVAGSNESAWAQNRRDVSVVQ
ncbi:peptidoglycan-associated lipoprotein Pal [Emcibacter sp. SYSU 3D8]|uniref:peptidoglycan-associated lipoprotein Pal n=1 Tax=Emcibacter sp. SYSU 3D8 TaxID=3133969 RepID=UPI0031FF2A6E